jgi:hypothetical protein
MKSKQKLIVLLMLIAFAVWLQFSAPPARAEGQTQRTSTVLYDASSAALPDSALMPFISVPFGLATQTFSAGATTFDSTAAGTTTYAGYGMEPGVVAAMPTLDRTLGFEVKLTFQMVSEAHNNSDRAGWSLIVLSDDMQGLELAFWEGEVWAQHDDSTGSLFTHAEGAAFDTTAGLVDFSMIMLADTYTVTADTIPILSGPVRDYTAFSGTIDPYETPNFIFLGDDSTSAQAEARFTHLSILTAAAPTSTPSPSATQDPATATPSDLVFLPLVQGPDSILMRTDGCNKK